MKRWNFLLLALTLVLLIGGLAQAQPVATYSGVVLDSTTEFPIPGVEIIVLNEAMGDSMAYFTDEAGEFSIEFDEIENNPGVQLAIVFSHPDYFANFVTLDLQEGDNIVETVYLTPNDIQLEEYMVSGTVTDAGGNPVAGAVIWLVGMPDPNNPLPPGYFEASTDENGNYQAPVNEGNYRIACLTMNISEDPIGEFFMMWYDGVTNPEEATIVPVFADVSGIDFNLTFELATISGTVTDQDGNPVANAEVFAESRMDSMNVFPHFGATVTDENGQYSISLLSEMVYHVSCTHPVGITLWYDQATSYDAATPIPLPDDVDGIDFVFEVGTLHTVSGQVDFPGEPGPANFFGQVTFVSQDNPNWQFSTYLDETGTYAIDVLEGNYTAVCYYFLYDFPIEVWYDNVTDPSEATVISVTDDVSGIDFTLDFMLHTISGLVTDANGQPVANAWIFAETEFSADSTGFGDDYFFYNYATTDESGYYELQLVDGSYRIGCSHPLYPGMNLWYDQATTYPEATILQVDSDLTNINFSFDELYTIQGMILDMDGQPAPQAYVTLYGADGFARSWASTNESGHYTLGALEGTYYLQAVLYSENSDVNPFIYEMTLWYDGATGFADASPLNVSGSLTGIDFDFSNVAVGSISGQVFDQETNEPVTDGMILLMPTVNDSLFMGNVFFSFMTTDENGFYEIGPVPEGDYIVGCFAGDYIPLFYDQAEDYFDATPVVITAENLNATNINFAMYHQSILAGTNTITGTVYDLNEEPLANAHVFALPTDPTVNLPTISGTTDDFGNFSLANIPDGTYVLLGSHTGYIPAYHTEPEWNEGDYVLMLESIEFIDLVSRDDILDVDIYLADIPDFGGGIDGLVTTNEEELRLAVIYAYDEAGQVVSGGLSTFDGEFTVPGLHNGNYTLEATRIGYHPAYHNSALNVDLESAPVVGDVHFDLIPEVTAVEDPETPIQAVALRLDQNYPNPFNPVTTIAYAVPKTSQVKLAVYNPVGQLVKVLHEGEQGPGEYRLQWDGTNQGGMPVASGFYFYRLDARHDAGTQTEYRRMMLLK